MIHIVSLTSVVSSKVMIATNRMAAWDGSINGNSRSR